MSWRGFWRWLLALAYLAAGVLHIWKPVPFIGITPHWVPMIPVVVALTGVAEVMGAVGLVQPWSAGLRRAAGWGLAAYAVCVFPANINHMIMDMRRDLPELGWGYHAPRMLLQPILVWLALWASGVTEWPWRRARV